MTNRKHVVRVTILGEEHTIKSDASPEHARAIAEYVDRAIRAITNNGSSVVEPHKAAILAAMKITDELFAARSAADDVATSLQSLSGEVRRWLPPSKRRTPADGTDAVDAGAETSEAAGD
ncbi:MAG TPA: cell division protein ZapA [Gemmatimonadaceae bacterium]|nr:cell division protein ZapA [Gemmatimonadaceae bacterium]